MFGLMVDRISCGLNLLSSGSLFSITRDFAGNQLSGSIPNAIGSLVNLQSLYASTCHLKL